MKRVLLLQVLFGCLQERLQWRVLHPVGLTDGVAGCYEEGSRNTIPANALDWLTPEVTACEDNLAQQILM